jgi:Divergent InlB B-repeat domain/Bacterial Ig-like domain (group 2)
MKKKLFASIILLALVLFLVPGCSTVGSVLNGGVATNNGIYSEGNANALNSIFSPGSTSMDSAALWTVLTPTKSALANTPYAVNLIDKSTGKIRATIYVTWTQPELNISEPQAVIFSNVLNADEEQAYDSTPNNLFNAFLIRISTQNTTSTPASTPIIVPNTEDFTSISIAPTSLGSLSVGTYKQLTATGTYPNGSTLDITSQVTWNSSNPAAATISSSGVANCEASGTTDITAVFNKLTSQPVVLTVVSVASITVSPSNPTNLLVGSVEQFSAAGSYPDGSHATISSPVWTSSNPSVANINSSGEVTAASVGSTNITASMSGVTSAPVSLRVTPSTYTLNIQAAGGTVSMNGKAVTGNTTIAAGQNIILTATAPTDYFFAGWSGDASGKTNPLTITMNSDKNVTALLYAETPESPVTKSGTVSQSNSPTESIQLTQGEWIKGTITPTPAGTNFETASIHDPSGNVIKDPSGNLYNFSGFAPGWNFTFMAQTTGTYVVTFSDSNEFYSFSYNLTYTIDAIP